MADKKLLVVLGADTSGFTKAMDTVKNSTKTATDSAKKGFDNVGGAGEKGAGKVKSAFGTVAKVVATAFAVDKVIGFGKSVVEQSASAQAMEAQFTQVFGNMDGKATEMIGNMGSEFNMLPNRIKPVFTSLSSMFMGVGMDSETAMKVAQDATMASADAAAFYDTSMESASNSVKSFMKGNYEAGESIGLFANDTQMAQHAIKSGVVGTTAEWSKLDEATKMATRADYITKMQEQSGAMGQASREGSGYENVMGNLSQAWKDFQSALGRDLLPAVVKVVEDLTQGLQNVNVDAVLNGFSAFGGYLMDVFTPAFEATKEVVKVLWDAFKDAGGIELAKSALEGIKSALEFVKTNAESLVPILAGLAGGFLAFQVLTGIAGIIGAVTSALTVFKTATSLANAVQLIFNGTLLANPFTWVAIAIGVLIASIVAIWKNWDTVSQALSAGWDFIKEKASSVFTALSEFFSTIWEGIKSIFSSTIEWISNVVTVGFMLIQSIVQGIFLVIQTIFQTYWNIYKAIIETVMNVIKAVIQAIWNQIGGVVTNVLGTIKNVITTVWNAIKSVITTVVNAIKAVITTVWNAISSVTSSVFNAIKGVATTVWNAIKSAITTVVNAIKSVVTSVWNAISAVTSSVFNAVKSVASSVWNGIKSAITTVVNAIKSVVSNVWNSIKSVTSSVFNGIKSTATSVWNGIKSAMITPIESAKNKIQGIVNAIKGFFSNMKLSFPKLSMPPLPHFSLSGSFSLKPPSVPKLGVSWYETGGIATGASVVGIGENGDEAILPLSNKKRMKPFASAVAHMMNDANEDAGITSGDTIITGNNFTVREEADIKKVAQELHKLQQKQKRLKGK